MTKKEDLQNVASPWPVKLNLALAESDVKKDLDLKINVLNITLKSCPITMQDGQNSVAFGIIPRVLAAGIENGGTCNYETLIPSPENPLLQPIPSEATVQSVMARIAQQSQSPTDNFFHGDQSDIASGDATIEINNFKNLFLDSSTNNISRLPDMELKIKLPLSLSQGEINQIVGNYKIGSALVESLRAYSLVSSGQQYQLPEKLDIPLKFGINGSEVNIRMIGVVGRNEHNQIIASFPLQASYKIDVISGDKFSITVGGNYIGRSATCVANMSWNIFSGSNASGRFTASYDPISGIHNEMLEVSLFTGGNSGQSSTPTPSQNTGGIIVDSLPDINYELTLGDDPNNIIEGIFKTKDIFDAMRRSHLPDMQQPSQNNGPVQPRSFDSTQNNPNINNNINITDPLGGRSDLGNLFPRDSMGNIFVVSSDLGKNKPDIYFISDSSNDVLAVNQNDLRQGNVQNLVLEPQFNKAAAPSDPQKLIAGVKPALDQKNSQDFCDPNLFDCSIYQNKNRLYPVVPVLTKSVESLTTGEKKNYQEQYLNYVGEYNTTHSNTK
ncbi:MAG: hypothetical protein M1338_02025, partial [Patescibacteria group bacterium]|nr:hypothetical protein [Patescibacteria group bacterium]